MQLFNQSQQRSSFFVNYFTKDRKQSLNAKPYATLAAVSTQKHKNENLICMKLNLKGKTRKSFQFQAT